MSKLNDLITKLCPNGVPYRKLGEIVDILDSKRKPVKRGSRVSGKYPYYGANGVQDYINDYLFDGEFLLVGEDGSVITDKGTPILNWANGKIWVNNHAHVLQEKADKQYMLRYIKYALECKNIAKLIHGAIPKLNQQTLKSIEIPVPPLPVQSEVVRILDAFTELEAELEAELAGRKEQYEYYRDYLLDEKNLEAMDGKPVETKKLNEVFDSFNGMGGVSNKWADDGNCQFIDYKNVYDNTKVDVSNTPYATVKKIPNQRVVKQGDILCTCASETPNECALSAVVEDNIRDNIFLDDHLFGLRVKEEYADLIDTTFINYYFTIFNHRKNVFKAVRGVTRYYIDTKAFMRIPIPVPSLATQERVVGILDRFDALTTSLTDGIPAEIAMRREQYEYYRSRLLDFPRLPEDSDSDGDSNGE